MIREYIKKSKSFSKWSIRTLVKESQSKLWIRKIFYSFFIRMGIGEIVCFNNLMQIHLILFQKNSSSKELVWCWSYEVAIFNTSKDDKIKFLFKFFSKNKSELV